MDSIIDSQLHYVCFFSLIESREPLSLLERVDHQTTKVLIFAGLKALRSRQYFSFILLLRLYNQLQINESI